MTRKEKIDRLRAKLLRWNDAYHEDEALVPDEEYDRARDLLEKLSPQDRFFAQRAVGAPVQGKNKVELPFPMPSLVKVRTGRGVEKWLALSSGTIDVSDKLDGSSVAVVMQDGQRGLYTRGNGTIGRDITFKLPQLKGLGRLLRNEAVRCEAVMKSKVFEGNWTEDYDDNRGLVNGVINSGKNARAIADVDIIAHGLLSPRTPWHQARVKLKGQGWLTVPTKRFKNPTPDQLETYLAERRRLSPYPLDGLVLSDPTTGKTVSFKVDMVSVPMVVDHVEYNLTRHSVYKPIVKFKTPTRMGGVMVKQATGHNAAYIEEHGIGPGAIVMVVRAGDVIPKVVGTKRRAHPQLPEDFKWNGVEAMARTITKADTLRITGKQLSESFRIMGVEGARFQSAVKLVEGGIDDLVEAYHATVEDFEDAGLGVANSAKLFTSLQQSRSKATHAKLMYASHVWPRGFAEDKFNLVLQKYPYKLLAKASPAKVIAGVAAIKGMSETSAKVFVKGLRDYADWLADLGWMPREQAKPARPVRGPLTGMSFVFTKVRDKALEELIQRQGGTIANSVSKTTTALVVRSLSETSTKSTKAEALDIPTYELPEFRRKFKLKG